MAGEKSEKATPKRKQEERKKGNIFQSREIVTVASMLIMFNAAKSLMPYVTGSIMQLMRFYIDLAATATTITMSDMATLFTKGWIFYAVAAMPFLFIAGLVSVIFTLAQTKLLVSGKSMEFKFSRLNPLAGLKKMFSIRSLVELTKSLIKISVLAYIIYNNFKDRFNEFALLFDMEIIQALSFLGDFIMDIVTNTAYIFVAVAIMDYVYQWWDYEKNLMMSKDEIKEEYKQTEGDPQIKGKIKEKQRQIAMSRMMQNVPSADVVIRNPTHFAVALKYSPDKNLAPIVIAKGMDELALRIVKVAENAGVVVTENKPLARGLYETVDIDREIPDQFYQPVAEVLAFVYSIKKKEMK